MSLSERSFWNLFCLQRGFSWNDWGGGGVGPVLYKNPLPGAPSRVGKETSQPAGDKKEMCESSTQSNLSVTVQNGWHRREGGL
jgi:hypothetical protein